MKDYRVTIAVKNNYLLSAMERGGFRTVAELCRSFGLDQSRVGEYANLKVPALDRRGSWRPSVLKLADALGCLPEELFPPQHYERALTRNRAVLEMDHSDVVAALADQDPERHVLDAELTRDIGASLAKLSARRRRAIELYFGLDDAGGDGMTYDEVAREMGVSRERVRQLILSGLRRMRHPANGARLLESHAKDRGIGVLASCKAETAA